MLSGFFSIMLLNSRVCANNINIPFEYGSSFDIVGWEVCSYAPVFNFVNALLGD